MLLSGLLLPREVTGSMAYALAALGLAGAGIASVTTWSLDKNTTARLDRLRRQLELARKQRDELLAQCGALDADLAGDAATSLDRRLAAAQAELDRLEDLLAREGSVHVLTDRVTLAEQAVARPYPNPVPVTRDGVRALLGRAWAGERPGDPVRATLDTLTAQVTASFGGSDERLRTLLAALAATLHGYAREHDLTQDEWQAAIDFLARTGHLTDERRQEFVLLSDTLGLSSVVDVLTNSRTPDTTSSAVLGPFYTDGPPELDQGTDVSAGKKGTPLWVDVVVTDTGDEPVAGAVVDIWQSDEDGFYDLQLPETEGPVLRGRFRTDDAGRLRFRSILPAAYPIPADGPVGEMLHATGRHPFRAPHLHFLIQAPGHRQLITQLFVAGGEHLDSDTVFGVKEDLVVDFAPRSGPMPDGVEPDGEWRLLEFTFRIARDR